MKVAVLAAPCNVLAAPHSVLATPCGMSVDVDRTFSNFFTNHRFNPNLVSASATWRVVTSNWEKLSQIV